MMRVIFLLLLSSIAFQSNSQTWNNYLQKRFKSYGIWADSILLLPSDTTINKAAKSLAVKNGNLYIANGNYWTEISGGSSSVDSLVYATKANVIKVRDSLLAADNFWLGVNTFSNILKVDNQIKVGLESGTTGSIKFYNQVHTNTATIFASDTLATDVDIELPTSSGKLALTTDIAIVDTTVVKTVVSARNDSLVLTAAINSKPNFGDVRDIVRDSLLIPKDTLLAHNTRILANQNAANTNAANINLKVNIADTASMLAGYKVASILTSGTLADARLSSNVALKNATNTFTENQTISKSNPQLDIVSATTGKATILREETVNRLSLTNDVLEIGGALSNCVGTNSSTQSVSSSPTSITGLTQWSVSFWFFVNNTNNNLIYFGDGTNAYRIRHAASTYIQLWYNGEQQGYAAVGWNFGVWNHVTITKDAGNTLRYYFNANLISTFTTSNISTINIFRIGNSADLPFGESGMTGSTRYDQVLFYNTALSLANVQTIYASGTGTTSLPSTGNLLLRYELNEGTGTTTVNQGSASTGNGTLVNGVVWNIATGKIPTEATTQLGTALQVRDGVLSGERGQYRFGDPFGGTILRGRSIKFQVPLETQFSFIHDGTSTLIAPANTNTSAVGASTLTAVGNATIGENVAAPTNGLRVVGNTLLQAKTFLGGTTTPTATLHIKENVSTAGGANIKFTLASAALLSTKEIGAFEAVYDRLYFTDSTNTRNTLAYLSDVAAKQNTITGAATTITTSNLTANRALISDGSGKVAVSAVTDTELGYVGGVTSNIQTQLNNKLTTAASNVKRYIRVDSTTYSGNYAMDGTKEVVLIDYADPCNITLPAVASLPDGSVFEIQFYNWAQTNKQVTIYPEGSNSEEIDAGFGLSNLKPGIKLKSNPQANSVTPLSLRIMWIAEDNVWTVLQGGVFDY